MSVVLLGVWWAAVGAADLGRTSVVGVTAPRARWCAVAGTAVLAAGLLVVDLGWASRLILLTTLAALLAGWVLLTSRALALTCLVTGVALTTLVAGLVRTERSWPAWLDDTVLATTTTSVALTTAGVLLAQISTANLLVRLLLDAVGVPATTGEKQLRGGRVLRPMERIFIVSLGALGQVAAASVVVAAKALLRFPELQRAQQAAKPPPDGPSDVTEYFLIGSLASWLAALSGAGLIRLAA